MSDLAPHIPEPGIGQQPSRLNLAPRSMRFWLMAHKVAAGFDAAGPELPCLDPERSGAFLFTVTGHSMSGAGIMRGDTVIADRSVAPEHGRLVIALVDGAYMLRRLFRFNGRFELRSENDALPQQRIVAEGGPDVWGVVVGVIRNYQPCGLAA
jgi:DNA polymerase V